MAKGRRRKGGDRRRAEFLGLDFDPLPLDRALAWIGARQADAPLAYVVTPNIDQMVRLERLSGDLRRAYEEADLCLCDSRPLARLARMTRVRLPAVPSRALTHGVLAQAAPGTHILLIGGGAAQQAGLAARYPKLAITQHVAPMGLLHDPAARAAAIHAAAEAGAQITLLAVGSPQQELMAIEMRRSGRVFGTALCVGAGVDMLLGQRPRTSMRRPWRLAKRYLLDCPAILSIVWRWSRRR